MIRHCYTRWAPVLLVGVALAACGGDEAAIAAAGQSGRHFDEGISKQPCEILTPALVAETFAVPASELRQMKMMGCIYSWKQKAGDHETILEANLTMLRAHETEEGAIAWFQKATANKTNEEARGETAEVTERVKEDERVDTETKKKAAGTLGSLMAEALPEDGYSYAPVDGIGDEARVALHDGAIWARVGNLTFTVSAYKGAAQPEVALDASDMKDLKQLTRKTTAAKNAWLEEKHAERKAAATKLAKGIIEVLP